MLPDGDGVALGTGVSGGGAYPHLSDVETDLAAPLADCPTNEDDEIAMFNAGARIVVE